MKVVVAPLFADWPAFSAPFEGMGREIAWADRPHAEFEVSDDETLGDTLERAAEELGVTVAPDVEGHQTFRELLTFYSFQPEGDQTAARAGWGYTITVVHDDGRAYWGQPFKEALWGDVRRAKEAGLLGDRDIERLYLVLTTPAGNGGLLTWATFFAAVKVLEWAVSAVSATEGSMQFLERVKARLGRVGDAIDQSAIELEERGALPDNLAETLGTGPWHIADLAGLLGVSEERAQGIVEGFGFGRDDAGLWRLKSDDAATLFYYLREESEIAHTGEHARQPDVALRDRLAHYVRTGERAEVPEHFQYEPWHDLTEEQVLARDAELKAAADESMADFMAGEDPDVLDDDLSIADEVPYGSILLKCACGDPDCSARLGFAREGTRIRLMPEGWTDHFVAGAGFTAMVVMAVAEEAEEGGPDQSSGMTGDN